MSGHRFAQAILGTAYLIVAPIPLSEYRHAMARIARVIAPGIPHHVAQRGNRRQQTFFRDKAMTGAVPV